MKLVLTIEFDRQINPTRFHHITPGPFTVKTSKGNITFDFMRITGNIDEDKPCVGCFEYSDLDTANYPESAVLPDILDSISSLEEIHIEEDPDDMYEVKEIKIAIAIHANGNLRMAPYISCDDAKVIIDKEDVLWK